MLKTYKIKLSILKIFSPTYHRYSEDAILIKWPEKISNEILIDIRSFVEKINEAKLVYVRECNFVYNSLLVIYDYNRVHFKEIATELKNVYSEDKFKLFESKKWLIPVCYDTLFGVDLELISNQTNISIKDIINLHSSTYYTIHGIGFLPGFLYLGGLTEKLHFPRLNTPRPAIEKGAIGIGGSQTGIYPQKSPGGWNIIGNTPISMFDINKEKPCLFTPGDKIKFKAIALKEYDFIKKDVLKGTYNLKKMEL